MSSPNDAIGRLIGEHQRYRLDTLLGAGGMGQVFLAKDTLLGKQVALKLLNARLTDDEAFIKRFEREVSICAALDSQHIVRIEDYGITEQGYPFFVMEYLAGETLGQRLRREQQLSVEKSVAIITQICAGLKIAHQGVRLWRQGQETEPIKIIHRDLKPENIFLVPTVLGDLAKILDFGIAKICEDQQPEYGSLTGTDMFIGTFDYASPEQISGSKQVDERSDIYSLGMILYRMLSGTDPFGFAREGRRMTGIDWALAHATRPPEPLRSQDSAKSLPAELERVVMRCLDKNPRERFASVDELCQALQMATRSSSPVQPTGTIAEPSPWQQGAGTGPTKPVLGVVEAKEQYTLAETPSLKSPEATLAPTELDGSQLKLPPQPSAEPAPPLPIDAGAIAATIASPPPASPPPALTDLSQTVGVLDGPGAASSSSPPVVRVPAQPKPVGQGKKPLFMTGVGVAVILLTAGGGYGWWQWQEQRTKNENAEQLLAAMVAFHAQSQYADCIKKGSDVPVDTTAYNEAQRVLNQCRLGGAKQLAGTGKLAEAIAAARLIPPSDPLSGEAEKLLNQWAGSILKLATSTYANSGQTDKAIALLRTIPSGSSTSERAVQLEKQWQEETTTNTQHLEAARAALDSRQWQAAIASANKVKTDTPYWKKRREAIVNPAQAELNRIEAERIARERQLRQPAPVEVAPARPAYNPPPPAPVAPSSSPDGVDLCPGQLGSC